MTKSDLPFLVKAIFIVAVLISLTGVITQMQIAKNNFQTTVNAEITAIESIVRSDFTTVSNHLSSLSSSIALTEYAQSNSPDDLQQVTNEFIHLASNNPLYDQIRFIDSKGMEKVRVDNTDLSVEVIPTTQLQDKSTRYYFSDTMQLKTGEIYISPLDLNVEAGKIETPYRPMLRFATPVFGQSEEPVGLVIINYSAGHLLPDRHIKGTLATDAHLMFINSDGFWLRGMFPQDEWGFIVPNRSDKKFQNRFPQAWNIIKENKQGFIFSREGVFSYKTIYPITEIQLGKVEPFTYFSRNFAVNDFYWIIASHVSNENMFTVLYQEILKKYLVILGIILVAGSAAIAIQKMYIYARRDKRRKQQAAKKK